MSNRQKDFHKITELIGVVAGVWLVWLSQQGYIPSPHDTLLLIFGVGNIVVDGLLLTTWNNRKKGKIK